MPKNIILETARLSSPLSLAIFSMGAVFIWMASRDYLHLKRFSNATQTLQGCRATILSMLPILIAFPIICMSPVAWGEVLGTTVGSLALCSRAILEPSNAGVWNHPRKKTAFLLGLSLIGVTLWLISIPPSMTTGIYFGLLFARHTKHIRMATVEGLESLELVRHKLLRNKASVAASQIQMMYSKSTEPRTTRGHVKSVKIEQCSPSHISNNVAS